MNFRGLGTGHSPVLLSFALLLVLGAVTLALGGPAPKSPTSGLQQMAAAPWGFSANGSESSASARQFRIASAKPPLSPIHLAQLPIRFEPNQGQTDSQVRFLARGSGYGLFLTADQAVLTLNARPRNAVVRMQLSGANAAAVSGDEPLPGKSNYFIGNDPAKWRRDIPQFARVRYQSVYPGIDLVYYGKQGQLEYDFELAPGADPKAIAFTFEGTQGPRARSAGQSGPVDPWRRGAPAGSANLSTRPQWAATVAGGFVLHRDGKVGFEVAEYDRSRSLVIDPVLGGRQSRSEITSRPSRRRRDCRFRSSRSIGGWDERRYSSWRSTGDSTRGCPARLREPLLRVLRDG